METEKSSIEVNERRKRIIFVLKVLAYFAFLVLQETIEPSKNLLYSRLYNIADALTFLLAGNILVSLGRIFLVRFYLRKTKTISLHNNFVLGINRIAHLLNVIILLIALMIFFEIDPKEFLSSITIVAAAIALLSRDYIINMLNGLIIMFSDQITLGDYIRVGEHQGRIKDITLLNVVLLNEDHDLVMIPNSLMLTANVVNYSRQNIRKLTFDFETTNHSSLDVDEMEKKLKLIIEPYNKEVLSESLSLKTISILKDIVKMKLQVQLSNPSKESERKIRRIINQSIIKLSGDEIK
ncbi:mechanosensitive ion channel family protein [Cyclobacterium marinum]|uniref:MscS Mechanosensitive ion channel n=1 Tax=Cyclobacterium marinum (strain ATCC 25205 / DSM 745 / LMG 13164 / NCIMB 1802) TaxID=880070 RepID=G0IUE8_CYCMS|nr:mechanosensitive ion channel domain-containing protein [Cyclobacterium marinum]AEL24143.1 MscS Mechanosensitive ion channel [Cyclobacterium marinum DSM 745]MBI0398849.1 mechanosensitive ion channel [Cyclobacterium marinum]